MKIVKHLLKCYFQHIFIILVASKRQTYRFKSSLHVFLFRNRVNRTRPKLLVVHCTAQFALQYGGFCAMWSPAASDPLRKIYDSAKLPLS